MGILLNIKRKARRQRNVVMGWFGSSWDENRESIEMLLMDGLDGEYDFFRRILLLG